ncbi:MAG TPA: PilZ domain-containing protein [Kofleriaceae bacterium]|jgi:CheY-like chemotaxis protein|nr:PilZ domain-containing protein [Kofleriaceae bacterium]
MKAQAVVLEPDDVRVDRRGGVRVVAKGSVIVYGRETTRGRLYDVSSGGIRMRLVDGAARCRCGEVVDVELHLDRTGVTWRQFRGEIMRVDRREVAICFTAMPLDFADVIHGALVSELDGTAIAHVLLIDPSAERRVPFAALLRRAGCRVAEAVTPLEAMAHLGSFDQDWVIAIANTAPASTAGELQRSLAESDPPVEVRVLGDPSSGNALSWFAATARAS